MKKTLRMMSCICALVLAGAGNAPALEVAELPTQLTRSYADKHFSKDYNYRLLEDSTVRRSWQAEGKTIIVDFDIASDKAVSIYIDYEPSAEKRTALADVKVLTEGRREGAKWGKTKKDAVAKIGVKNARLMRLTDKSLLFWESTGKEKCARLCWFAKAPTIDRMTLSDATSYTGRTALGNSGGGGMGAALGRLRDDEERRMHIEPVPVATAVAAAPKPAPKPAAKPASTASAASTTKPAVKPAPRPAAPVAVAPAAPADDLADLDAESDAPEAGNLLEAMGVEANNEVMKWAAVGGGVLLLLILWGVVSSSRRKAKQRAAFEKLLNSGDTKGKA